MFFPFGDKCLLFAVDIHRRHITLSKHYNHITPFSFLDIISTNVSAWQDIQPFASLMTWLFVFLLIFLFNSSKKTFPSFFSIDIHVFKTFFGNSFQNLFLFILIWALLENRNSSFSTFVHLLQEVIFFILTTLFSSGILKNGKKPHQAAAGDELN